MLLQGVILYCLWLPLNAAAEWGVVTRNSADRNSKTNVAYTVNESGYTLEIYRDSGNAIRSRFTMVDGLIGFADKSCPTYQIDKHTPKNRSINDAPCLSSKQWAEFIMGHVKGNSIPSSPLLELMNGISITFRFNLEKGNYRETKFSLVGSKRAMTTALGQGITVNASP